MANAFRNGARLQLRQYRPGTTMPFALFSYATQSNLSTSTTTRASLASTLPSQPTVLLHQPTQADIAEQELDLDLLSPELVSLDITDRAAEVMDHILVLEF